MAEKTYKLLITPGGGVYGCIPSFFYKELGLNYKMCNMVDFFAGTSVGGIISLILANGTSTRELHSNFCAMAKDIFNRPWYRRLNPFGPKHSNHALKEHLMMMATGVMGELLKPVIVPALDFENHKVKVFDNLTDSGDLNMPCAQVGLMTSAAPTFFPPYDGKIDGGLLENIPLITAVSAITSKTNIKRDELAVLIVGTGYKKHTPINMDKVKRWSALQWARPMVNFLTEANEMSSMFWGKELGLKYLDYYNPIALEPEWEMDDPDVISTLQMRCKENVGDFWCRFDRFMKQ